MRTHRSTSIRAAAAALALLAAPTVALASAAPASAAAAGCIRENLFDVSSGASYRIPFSGVPTFRNGPGGTMTVSRSYTGSAAYQVTAGTSAEVDAVLAKAKVEISASLTKTNSTSATNTYTRNITAGKFGNARYVSYGRTVSWYRGYISPTCTVVKTSSGTIRFPSTSEGWYYWETSS
ncbi:hypothetical protein [Kineococcus rhizosphaerae]|uniref:Secreted protein n=1 Tax=Kineococcus rhizosphaerae TaxID=559628 RepID=A0A2T0QZR4_9ACTN|nr:hypothetical protein [Kineococcus rhizosphaerae]PRY12189.1 hypothetical protein CLV37_111146 [Kineococcus rhizosphaerae]